RRAVPLRYILTIQRRFPTSLPKRPSKTAGGRLTRHAPYDILHPAREPLTWHLFVQILGRIQLSRVAPDMISSTVQGGGAMSSGGDAAAVSLNGTVRVTNPRNAGSPRPQALSEGLPPTCREG